MQRLLNHAVWDEQEAMGIVRDFVVEHVACSHAVAVLDETGQETDWTSGWECGCGGRMSLVWPSHV